MVVDYKKQGGSSVPSARQTAAKQKQEVGPGKNTGSPEYHTIKDKALPSVGHPASTTLIRKGSRADKEHYQPSVEYGEAKLRSGGMSAAKAKSNARKAAADTASAFARVQAKTGRFLDTTRAFTRNKKYR